MRSLTEMAGKAVGAAKATAAALAGYRGIFRTLEREHGELSVLLMRIAIESSAQARTRLFARVARQLLSHARAEDRELYAVLVEHPETRDLVLELEADHERIEDLIGELLTLPPSSSTWPGLFGELQRAVLDHVDREEHDVFPRARPILGTERAQAIDRRYHATRILCALES